MSREQKTLQEFISKAIANYNYEPEEQYWQSYNPRLDHKYLERGQ